MTFGMKMGGDLIVAAVFRLMQRILTSTAKTVPALYRLGKEVVQRVRNRWGIEPQRAIPAQAHPLDPGTREELDAMVKSMNEASSARRGADKAERAPPSGGSDETRTGRQHANEQGGQSADSQAAGPSNQSTQVVDQLEESLEYIAHEMKKLGFTTSYRVVASWDTFGILGNTYKHQNRFYVVGTRDGRTFLGSTLQDSQGASYIYSTEDDWLLPLHKEATTFKKLVKFIDFSNFEALKRTFPELAGPKGSMPAEMYIPAAEIVFAPPAFRDAVNARTKMSYDEIQERIAQDQAAKSAATSSLIPPGGELDQALTSLRLNLEPQEPWQIQSNPHGNELRNNARKWLNIGNDITKFPELKPAIKWSEQSDEFIKEWTEKYKHHLYSPKDYKLISSNMVTLAAMKKLPAGVTIDDLARFHNAFSQAFGITEKIAALMSKAQVDRAVRDRIIEILAILHNTKDRRILTEAYSRLESTAPRMYDLAHFHVIKSQYQHVIPVLLRKGAGQLEQSAIAYVLAWDPGGRILINFSLIHKGHPLDETLLHEMFHLAIHSHDFMYMRIGVPRILNLEEHHQAFGRLAFQDQAYESGLGWTQLQRNFEEYLRSGKLADDDRKLAMARVLNLPTLRAYAKMSNSDSLVILYLALANEFIMRRIKPTGLGADAWYVRVKTEPPLMEKNLPDDLRDKHLPWPPRDKRSVQDDTATRSTGQQEDIYARELRESILATLFTQVFTVSAGNILDAERMRELGLMPDVFFNETASNSQESENG